MTKHTHQNKAEQINNRIHNAVRLQKEKAPNQINGSLESKNIQKKAAVDGHSIQLRAYQIYQEKGGSALDNWLEAEQSLLNG